MRAWVLTNQTEIEKNPFRIVELPKPEPVGSEILVKIITCGICRTDLHIIEGDLPLKKSPIVLGHEIVGIVEESGSDAKLYKKGSLVGISWLNKSCGKCRFCKIGAENYCERFQATGWDINGGFAEYTVIDENYAFPLEDINLPPELLSPLMCPGIAGQCAFNLTELWNGSKLGIYGFGPTAYYLLKISEERNIRVYVSTRSTKHQEEAVKNGAVWAGNAAKEGFPEILDSVIVFPPVGDFVSMGLSAVIRGGTVVLAPVSMSEIKVKDYSNRLWGKNIKTLYNVNRKDAFEFLNLAKEKDMKIPIEVFPFDKLKQALILMKRGELKSLVAVLRIS